MRAGLGDDLAAGPNGGTDQRPAWVDAAREAAGRLGVAGGVTLLRGGPAAMPMTWGVLRPVVLLPAEADAWPPERRAHGPDARAGTRPASRLPDTMAGTDGLRGLLVQSAGVVGGFAAPSRARTGL